MVINPAYSLCKGLSAPKNGTQKSLICVLDLKLFQSGYGLETLSTLLV